MMEEIVINELNLHEALRYMGQPMEECDARILDKVRECEEKLLKAVRPRYVYQCFDIEEREDGIGFGGTSLMLRGNDIRNHLKGCSKAILFCATLSSEVDRLIRVAEINDMLEALALDCLASTAIEQLCDKLELLLKEEFAEYNMTWRYGIGYGDLSISSQKEFVKVLNASKLIGLNVTDSYILTPRKSVTAIIGLSKDKIEQSKRGCASCNLKGNCAYRKKGSHCNV